MMQHKSDDPAKDDANASKRPEPLTGWVVFRPKPWHFIGVFGSREQAERQRERAGTHYHVEFGTADVESGNFDGTGPE